MPWSLDPGGLAKLREELATMHLGLKVAILESVAATYAKHAAEPGGKPAWATDELLLAVAPALEEVRQRCAAAILHLDAMAERAQRKQNATDRAVAIAERNIEKALAGLQLTALTATGMPSAQNRWRPDSDPGAAFDPAGYFVYCLWGDETDRPIYVGQSTNILARLGTHATEKRGLIRCVTLLRCRTHLQMDDTETRMINHYQPRLNTRGIRPADDEADSVTA